MSADTPLVTREQLTEHIRTMVAEVLMVPESDVKSDSALIADLGAESIDFLDLLYRIEDVVGRKVPLTRWQKFLRERLPGADMATAITTAIVLEFAEREAK